MCILLQMQKYSFISPSFSLTVSGRLGDSSARNQNKAAGSEIFNFEKKKNLVSAFEILTFRQEIS